MSDITTTQIFTDGEKGITATKMNNIIAGSTIQTSFFSGQPAGSALNPTDQLLELTSGGTYARITGQIVSDSVATSPSITNMRLRSFNALAANCNFEVDQRNAGNSVTVPTGSALPWVQDRWEINKVGTMTATSQQNAGAVNIPGTSFAITQNFLRITLTGQETSLASGDYFSLQYQVEGPMLRELINDVHSLQVLVRSSVAGLVFGYSLRSPASTFYSLTNTFTIPSANTWVVLTRPNMSAWTGGTFPLTPGNIGYVLFITLAAGSSQTSSVNGSFQAGNFVGASGQGNFFGSAVNSTFDIAFVHHEPGPVCSQLMDLPFDQNLWACQRYLQKSYAAGTRAGTVVDAGSTSFYYAAGTVLPGFPFQKRMARVPTVTPYSPRSGAANALFAMGGSADRTISSVTAGETGVAYMVFASSQSADWTMVQWTADTGW